MSSDGLFTPKELSGLGKGSAGFFDALIRRVKDLETSLTDLSGGGDGGTTTSLLSVPALYKSGLTTSATPTTVTVAAGAAAPSTGAGRPISLAAPVTKTLAAFSTGSGGGGLTSALTISTWLHIHVVDDGADASDVILDTSPTSPAIPSPFSRARRVGSVLINASSQVTPYTQSGDRFTWETAPFDVNVSSTGTTAVDRVLSVPPGVVVRAIMSINLAVNSGGSALTGLISPKAVADVAPTTASNVQATAIAATNNQARHWVECDTDTAQTVRSRMSASGINNFLQIFTLGWVEYFGETP